VKLNKFTFTNISKSKHLSIEANLTKIANDGREDHTLRARMLCRRGIVAGPDLSFVTANLAKIANITRLVFLRGQVDWWG